MERRLSEQIESREARLSEISHYLIDAGGKRIRPAVAMLVFRACGGGDDRIEDIVDVAVALELIHSASLLHDDIIDGSAVRRGQDSALRRFGLAETLVAGDFLFGRAYHLCARFDEKLIHWAVRACIDLTEGEMMQGRFRHNPAVTFADYMEIVTRKTASLFAAGARTAAHLAGASEETVDTMAAAGLHVGLTFQMIDDVLDVTGTEAQTGKPLAVDLRDGNPSLPIVLALAGDKEACRQFERRKPSEAEIDALLGRLRRPEIIERCHRLALEHAEQSRQALGALAGTPYRENLLCLVDQLVERVS